MPVWGWIVAAGCLVIGVVGGFALGLWFFRRSMANMQWEDQDISQMAKRMGMNLNPRQLQVVKQQMKRAGSQPPPLFGKKSKNKGAKGRGIGPTRKK